MVIRLNVGKNDCFSPSLFSLNDLEEVNFPFSINGNSILNINAQNSKRKYTLYLPNRGAIFHPKYIRTNDAKTIEQIRSEQLSYLTTHITPLLISIIKNEEFEFGQNSESIRLVDNEMKGNGFVAKEWFNRLFNQYFASKKETNILIGLLRIVEFLNERFYPIYKTIALASLTHADNEVKELGVRILEGTCSIENLKILKNVRVEAKWLQEYINQVIEDFEQILCLS